jgi:hypothetical protein
MEELLVYAVRKRSDSIDCNGLKLHNLKIDFGEIDTNKKVSIKFMGITTLIVKWYNKLE